MRRDEKRGEERRIKAKWEGKIRRKEKKEEEIRRDEKSERRGEKRIEEVIRMLKSTK